MLSDYVLAILVICELIRGTSKENLCQQGGYEAPTSLADMLSMLTMCPQKSGKMLTLGVDDVSEGKVCPQSVPHSLDTDTDKSVLLARRMRIGYHHCHDTAYSNVILYYTASHINAYYVLKNKC